ncbi:MAG TPA: penicillin-binding transpeptidase domain-containing protein [Acidobacteriota bacterium]|nr:penicillin-binding transpeptidase domain-containing protein [Acidobacteriota bacterium]
MGDRGIRIHNKLVRLVTSGRLILWVLPLILLMGAWAAIEGRRQQQKRAQAERLLQEGRISEAAEIVREVPGRRAHALRLVAQALDPDQPEPQPSPPLALQGIPWRVLLQQNLEKGRHQALLRLTRLLDRVEEPSVETSLYGAAALLELGRHDQAEARLRRLSADWRGHPMAGRVSRSLQLLARGARTLIRDRNDTLIGYLDADGQLQLLEGIDPSWLPRQLAERLRRHGQAGGLRLTLDLELSRISLASLRGRRGSVVLLDPPSGDILAAVSDSRTLRREKGTTPAFQQRREPASIAKLITLSAALRAGVDIDGEVRSMRCNGTIRYPDGVVWCPVGAGRVRSIERALALSCNTAFAKLGDILGAEALLAEFRRFGFDSGQLNGFPLGRILIPDPEGTQLGNLSIGLEATDITPLHSALMAAIFANQGKMPVPGLIKAETGVLGYSWRRLQRGPALQVIDPIWIPRLQRAMQAVTRQGTAQGIAPYDFPVAMKTGTGRNPGLPFHTNYIGVGPLPRPNIAFSVRITNYWSSKKARYATRTVSRRLLRSLRYQTHSLESAAD